MSIYSRDKALSMRTLKVSACILVFFLAAKVWGYAYSGSLPLEVSAVDTASDLFGLLFAMICLKIASIPLDENHRYGHGKVESIGVLASGIFLVVLASIVLFQGVSDIFFGVGTTFSHLGFFVLSISALADAILSLAFYFAYKRSGSLVIRAQFLQFMGDVVSTTSLCIGSGLHILFPHSVLGYFFALCVVFWLIFVGIKLMKRALMQLTDHVLDDDAIRPVLDIIKNTPECYGIHDVRSRDGVGVQYLECHIELDGNLSLTEAHHITEKIERKVRAKFPRFVIFLHQEPRGIKDERLSFIGKNQGR